MKRQNPVVLAGHNLGFRHADGNVIFSHLEFGLTQGFHCFIQPDSSNPSVLFKLLANEISPSEGAVQDFVERKLCFTSAQEEQKDICVADELKFGEDVRALRQIQQGAIDEKLFAVLAESWDCEEKCRTALNRFGLSHLDLLAPLSELSPTDKQLVRLASIQMHQPQLLIWFEPESGLDESAHKKLVRFLRAFEGTLLMSTQDQDLLNLADHIWILTEQGLRHHQGSFQSYIEVQKQEVERANQRLHKAELELKHCLDAAEEAQARRRARRDRAQKFADTGIPKVHRGNMKRKSQESMAKAKLRDLQKIERAEQHLREAMQLRQQVSFAQPDVTDRPM